MNENECMDHIMQFDASLILFASGCCLKVDIIYPKELHDSHNDMLFCPERMIVKHHMLSY